MRHAAVFDWAQVKLAEECLSVLFKANAPKQHLVTQLANAGGVTVTWDGTGTVKLEGSWERILKSQMVFENYLKTLEDSDTTEHKKRTEFDSEKTLFAVDDVTMEISSSKNTVSTDTPKTDGNEVYVNITLSSSELSGLDSKSIQLINSIHEVTDIKGKESIFNVSDYQQEVLYSICDPQVCNCAIGKPHEIKETVLQSSSIDQDQYVINNDPRIHHTVHEVSCSENIPPLETNNTNNRAEYVDIKCQLENESSKSESVAEGSCITSNSSQVKQKYRKKKDYEELAPFKFFCSLCSFKSKRESHFTRHMKLHNEVSELFKCSHCSFTSIRLSHLRRHELNHSNLALSCNVCRYHTNSQKLLVRHKRIKHSATKVPEVKKDLFQCVHCEYQTSRYYFLQRHLRIHITDPASIQVYQCEQCSYKTNRKEHFIRHTNNIHKGQRPFLCHLCGKAFKRQDALKQHSSTHATQAAVTCSECGKGCRSQVHLSQHMSVHSSDRLFLCELCGASFKTRAVQRKHMITIHQHPKAFLCSHCSRKFSTKFALRRHIKQHSSQISVEKKSKHQEQQTCAPMSTPNTSSSTRLVAMDTVFLSEPARSHPSEQTVTGKDTPRVGDKMTLQLAENYETVSVVPAQTIMQPSSETTALVYLTGPFASI